MLRLVTVMYWKLAPVGAETVSEVVVAADTVALVAPKKTMLLDSVVLKPVPVMVTVVPTGPDAGEKDVMLTAFSLSVHNMRTKSDIPFFRE